MKLQDQANRERRARKKVNLDCLKQVALAGIGGAVSGAGMGAIGFAVSNARNKVFTLSDIENSEADVASYVFIDSENIEEKSTAIDKAYSEVLKNGKSVEISNELLEKYETISKNPVVKLKDAIKEFYDLHIKGKSVRVEVRNGVIEIAFENDGKKKSVGWRMKPDKAATFERLLELTGNSVYAYSEYNRDTNEATSIPYFHYFMGDAVINGEHIPVKIQVRNIAADKSAIRARYYTHNLINKKGTESDSPVAGAKSANIDSNAYTSVPESTIPQSGSDVNTENTQAGVGVTIEEAGPPADGNAEVLIDYGDEQTTASLGIPGGSRTDRIRLVTAGETISSNMAGEMAFENDLHLQFFGGGNLHIGGRAVQAYINDGIAYVRVDAPNKTSAQLMQELIAPLQTAQEEAQSSGMPLEPDDLINEQEAVQIQWELQEEKGTKIWEKEAERLGLSEAEVKKLRLWKNRPSVILYKEHKAVFDNPKYFNQETGEVNWPVDDGFLNGWEQIVLRPGTRIDRYGYETGRYASPEGVPFKMRALAPNEGMKIYNVYEVVKPIPVRAGIAAPYFDQPGGGMQYKLEESVQALLRKGIIRRVII